MNHTGVHQIYPSGCIAFKTPTRDPYATDPNQNPLKIPFRLILVQVAQLEAQVYVYAPLLE